MVFKTNKSWSVKTVKTNKNGFQRKILEYLYNSTYLSQFLSRTSYEICAKFPLRLCGIILLNVVKFFFLLEEGEKKSQFGFEISCFGNN